MYKKQKLYSEMLLKKCFDKHKKHTNKIDSYKYKIHTNNVFKNTLQYSRVKSFPYIKFLLKSYLKIMKNKNRWVDLSSLPSGKLLLLYMKDK